ncbi:hypothetical protein [Spirillospora sp. CA-294931]|uniref:hypothetical protein n=1 Tax=Spirillospora sp. CA-294931 TaxID=3240042 RepID=UPI003D9027AB
MDLSNILYWTFICGAFFALFISPSAIALIRRVDNIGMVLILNAVGIVTLLILPVAWWLAFTLPRRLPPRPETGSDHSSRSSRLSEMEARSIDPWSF